MVLAGSAHGETVWLPLDALLIRAKIAVTPFDAEQAGLARASFLKYGNGMHSAALNFSDSAAYALAKSKASHFSIRAQISPKPIP